MFKSHRTVAITTTAFKSDLIVPCIGTKLLTSQSRTPTNTTTTRIGSKGICLSPSLRRYTLRPVPRRWTHFCVEPRADNAGWSGREPAISSNVQVKILGLDFAAVLLIHLHANILEEAAVDICSLVHTFVSCLFLCGRVLPYQTGRKKALHPCQVQFQVG